MSKGGGGDEDSSNNHDLLLKVRRTIDGGDNDSSSQNKDPQQSHKKRVQFADQVDEMTLPALPEDFAEICQIYWVRDALKTIRVSLKLTARDIRKKHSRQVQALEFAYSLAAQLVDDDDDDGKEAAELSSNDSMLHDVSEQAAQLKPWCCCLINGRGLERQVSNQQRLERANAVERSRRLVLSMSSSNANAEETIAHAYGEQARVATVFARIAGQADAVVAAATEQEQRRRRRPSALEILVRRNSHRHMLMNDIQQQRDHAHHHHEHFL